MEKEAAQMKSSNQPLQAPPPAAAAAVAPPQRNFDEAKIQIRLIDGKKLEQTFGAKEQLSAVRLYVEMNRPKTDVTPIKLMTSFPRKVFTEEDYDKPLDMLGLCPSSVIIL